jgi:4-hydroxy-3-polyprenylbenzoate decarboxylase
MSYSSTREFILSLEQTGLLTRIERLISPELEMSEITDRLSKNNGHAVLFTNTGTDFSVLMNAFGSRARMLAALKLNSYQEFDERIEQLFSAAVAPPKGFWGKLKMLKTLKELKHAVPSHHQSGGVCFEVAMNPPDLEKIPVLKCWPHDGGKFITLPMVHTIDPDTGITNIGMYRMQVFDGVTTGMHWHRHKGGAAHFEKYREKGLKMPVVVTLGGDPVYTYAATAPLPEMISEYAFAGFLRKKRVKLVKCYTCDIEVPEDVDFVIEGYIDPAEDFRTEGPFGDHTGFYSLPDKYPVFHITRISHRKDAVYPATIVGIPPMEDAFMGEATERLFFPLIKKLIVPEIVDMYLPVEGGFHNLAIVSIKKSYPGQAVKVMNALWGAGQMMFVRNIIVVDEQVNVRDFSAVTEAMLRKTVFPQDFHFMFGPLDVLDHANSMNSFGRKMGVDATNNFAMKHPGLYKTAEHPAVTLINLKYSHERPFAIMFVNKEKAGDVKNLHFDLTQSGYNIPFTIYLDHQCATLNEGEQLWMFLANFDPEKNVYYEKNDELFITGFDGTLKTVTYDGISEFRPNVITMDEQTIRKIDAIWTELKLGNLLPSPSLRYKKITLTEGYLYEK